jgi:hypothetical protein
MMIWVASFPPSHYLLRITNIILRGYFSSLRLDIQMAELERLRHGIAAELELKL